MSLSRTRKAQALEALDALFKGYNKQPFIDDFAKRYKIAKSEDKAEMKDLLKGGLLEWRHQEGRYDPFYGVQLEDLVDYLDRLQETGRQHTYFYRLPRGLEAKVLALADPCRVERLIGSSDRVTKIFNKRRFEWTARTTPALVAVWHRPKGRNELLLQWVMTRHWEEYLGKSRDEGAKRWRKDYETREERSVTFFRLDLKTGDSELRIQELQGTSREARQQQVKTYRSLATKFLGFDPFEALHLERVIRRVISRGSVKGLSYTGHLSAGGLWQGGEGEAPPVDPQNLQRPLGLRYKWVQPIGGTTWFTMDSETDELHLGKPCVPEHYQRVLAFVRSSAAGGGAVELPGETSRLEEPGPAGPDSVTIRSDEIVPVPSEEPDDEARQPLPKPSRRREIWRFFFPISVEIPPSWFEQNLQGDAAAPGTSDDGPSPSSEAGESLADPSLVAVEQFLKRISKVAEQDDAAHEEEIGQVGRDERFVSRLFNVASVLALLILVTGVVLVMLLQWDLAVGVVAALISLVPGAGSAMFRLNAKRLEGKRTRIEARRRRILDILQTIHLTLAIPDADMRASEMRALAVALREQAMTVSAS